MYEENASPAIPIGNEIALPLFLNWNSNFPCQILLNLLLFTWKLIVEVTTRMDSE